MKFLPLGPITSGATSLTETLAACLDILSGLAPTIAARLRARVVPTSVAPLRALVSDVMDAINRHVPPFTYFGYQPASTSTLGVWVDLEALHHAEHEGQIVQAYGPWRGIRAPYVLDMGGAGLTLYRTRGKVQLWTMS